MKAYLADRKKKLQEFAKRNGLRADWHEPDEQDVVAEVVGMNFDNAMGDDPDGAGCEMVVIISKLPPHTDDTLRINLATLLAIACG